MLEWQETTNGHRASGRITYLINEAGGDCSCFLAGRDVPNARFADLQKAKRWCEQLDGHLPESKIEWREEGDKHWVAVRPRGDTGTRYDIYLDSRFVGRPGMYSIVVAQWDKADFHHATLEAAQRQCEELDVAPGVPRDAWIIDPLFD